MSVKNEHKDYSILKKSWIKCIDFMESETAVHSKGEDYLPKLTEQEPGEYDAYKKRTPVTMLAQRANKAMVGMVTRKESYIEGSKLIPELIEKADSKGNSLHTYVSKLLKAFFTTGRGATLVDVPEVKAPITVAQAEAAGIRPRLAYYKEQDIINWRTKKINNVEVLVMVVLRESINEIDTSDEFSWESNYRYRVLDLANDTIYRQRLYNKDGEKIGADIIPKMGGKFLTNIPIVIHGGVEGQTPPLDQIVDLNLHHYQLSADEIHGLRMTALPTPYFFGEDPSDEAFPTHIGPTRMIGSDNENAKIGFLEFTGVGLQRVAEKLQKMEDTIAMLSIQMATEQINKSATGSSIDYSSSTSSLAGIVQLLSAELTEVLQIAATWLGKDPTKVNMKLNDDFAPVSMTPQMLQALLQAYQSGAISYATFYKNLAEGEITDPHKDPSEELREIEEDMPAGLTIPDTDEEEADDTDEEDNKNTGDNVE